MTQVYQDEFYYYDFNGWKGPMVWASSQLFFSKWFYEPISYKNSNEIFLMAVNFSLVVILWKQINHLKCKRGATLNGRLKFGYNFNWVSSSSALGWIHTVYFYYLLLSLLTHFSLIYAQHRVLRVVSGVPVPLGREVCSVPSRTTASLLWTLFLTMTLPLHLPLSISINSTVLRYQIYQYLCLPLFFIVFSN